MKATRTIVLAAAATLAMAACGNKAGNEAAAGSEENDKYQVLSPFVRINADSATAVLSIRDNYGEKTFPNKLFYGENDSAEVEKLSPTGKQSTSVSCVIVETGNKRALFDTGNGKDKGGQLMERLNALGIKPEDIDYIFITHMHNDHTGGLTEDGLATFTRAKLYVPAAEYNYWLKKDGPNGKAVKAVKAYGDRAKIFNYSEKLPLGIEALAAPGHTPGHTVYKAGRVLVVGDLFHALALQVQDTKLCADFDMDRKKAIESREKFLNYAVKNDMVMAGMHFFGMGIIDYKIRKAEIEESIRNSIFDKSELPPY